MPEIRHFQMIARGLFYSNLELMSFWVVNFAVGGCFVLWCNPTQ